MQTPIQHFAIANMVFVTTKGQNTIVTQEDRKKIIERFKELVDSFIGKETYYDSGGVPGVSRLPYSSFVRLGSIRECLVVYCGLSYRNPTLFIVNTTEHTVQNYMDFETAKNILDDDIYEAYKSELHSYKGMDLSISPKKSMEEFMREYERVLDEHKNSNTLSGMDCFKYEFELV